MDVVQGGKRYRNVPVSFYTGAAQLGSVEVVGVEKPSSLISLTGKGNGDNALFGPHYWREDTGRAAGIHGYLPQVEGGDQVLASNHYRYHQRHADMTSTSPSTKTTRAVNVGTKKKDSFNMSFSKDAKAPRMWLETFQALTCLVGVPVPREWFVTELERRLVTKEHWFDRQSVTRALVWGVEVLCQETATGSSKGVVPGAFEVYATENTASAVAGKSTGLATAYHQWLIKRQRWMVSLKMSHQQDQAEAVIWLDHLNIVLKTG